MTTEKSITMCAWNQRATPEQKAEFYARANTSYCANWQVIAGRHGVSAQKAAVIEAATIAINEKDPTLPPVLRTSTCSVCAECPFATKAGAV